MKVLPKVLGIQEIINEFIQYVMCPCHLDTYEMLLCSDDDLKWAFLL
jgi:hypothetical protein